MDLPLIKTADINLAASLLCFGFNVDGIDNHNLQKVYFLFRRTEQIENIIDLYWRGDLKVNPKEFANARREIMARIHEGIEESQPSES
jgi:hypothetical protein